MRKFLSLAFLICLWPGTTFSQANVTPKNELPMYGGLSFTRQEEQANADFVEYQLSLFGTKETAFENLYARAWDHFFAGDWAMTMKRFNQLWLIDPERPEVHFGFGCVLTQMGRMEEAVKYFRTAAEKYGFGPAQNALGVVLGQGAEGPASAAEANSWYETSEKRGYSGVWKQYRGQMGGEVFKVAIDGFKRENGIGGHFHDEKFVRKMNDKSILRWTVKEVQQGTGERYSVISAKRVTEFFKALQKQPKDRLRNGLWLVLPAADLRSDQDQKELLELEELMRQNGIPYFQCLMNKLPDGWVRIN